MLPPVTANVLMVIFLGGGGGGGFVILEQCKRRLQRGSIFRDPRKEKKTYNTFYCEGYCFVEYIACIFQ